MKKITLLVLFCLTSLAINAQTVLTHSSSQAIDGNTVACGNSSTGTSSDNRYYRAFNLASMGVTSSFNLSAIQFGVASLTAPSGYVVTVKAYSTTATFPTGFPATGYTLLGQADYTVQAANVGTIVSVPLTATVPANSTLVVEVGYAAGATGVRISLGSNTAPQTGPSYIASTACSIATPTDVAAINFPDVHMVINAVGTTLGVNEFASKLVSVFPNPTSGSLTVQMPNELQINKAALVDVSGKQFAVSVNNGNTIDISGFATGIYMLNLETAEGTLVKKIVKQ
ncbi:T9SS type A sorting domain-containing protein [Flavobacterium supellecticarium]|uniref:T9SS type A sorting domain-containing protein n=1 Tax=Flavobacterium supellecticarium TaxID=2565924 RepID=A0A4V3W910_9FLAO|nr:T9SS type A sorting domain-containing protein [Flavobacterium supellecticarium]THF53356.1 T9SS type A sorting domain-containing protein [Flavobacterium supellecticarium]